MMTRPASLTEISQDDRGGIGSLLSSVAATSRNGFIAVLRLIAQPAPQPNGDLSYPMVDRARRFLRGRD